MTFFLEKLKYIVMIGLAVVLTLYFCMLQKKKICLLLILVSLMAHQLSY